MEAETASYSYVEIDRCVASTECLGYAVTKSRRNILPCGIRNSRPGLRGFLQDVINHPSLPSLYYSRFHPPNSKKGENSRFVFLS